MRTKKRSYPYGHKEYMALDHLWWNKFFDNAQKCALYSCGQGANDVTLLGYYEKVSLANIAASETTIDGVHPKVAINWSHSSITKAANCGPVPYPDATVALPDWLDEAAKY